MKEIFKKYTEVERFSINDIYINIFENILLQEDRYKELFDFINFKLGNRYAKKLVKGVLRISFFIEPVKKPKIETTKFSLRWSIELSSDPRFASYDDCLDIFDKLLSDLLVDLEVVDNINLIKLMQDNTLVSYETPIDYLQCDSTRIHRIDNISWVWGEIPQKTISLRNYLRDEEKHEFANIFTGVYSKIKVKTYLTDRVLTGKYKTNREKRWECHPESVHFALRKDAWMIEYKLVSQLCNFKDFPADLRLIMQEDGIMVFNDDFSRCPITYEPLDFSKLKDEILNTTHGKSSFQVGHMHPLKAGESDHYSGHTSDNISWISDEGNRIQGSNSVEFTHSQIAQIYDRYKEFGIIQ
jgi:hypothetical protein